MNTEMKLELEILPIEQMTEVKGRKKELLSIFKKIGTKCAGNSLVRILGGFVSKQNITVVNEKEEPTVEVVSSSRGRYGLV